jgi:hypothetical protein
MAKRPKVEKKVESNVDEYAKYAEFEDYSWVEGRQQEINKQTSNYDPTTDIHLRPRWQGYYNLRFWPIRDPRDWMVPIGAHLNVWKAEDEFSVVPCPRITHAMPCTICQARDWAISRRIISRDDPVFQGDKEGKGGMKLDIGYLSRVLLLNFTPNPKEKEPPAFEGFPLLRIFKFNKSCQKAINSYMKNPNVGQQAILGLKTGIEWSFEKSQDIKPYWWQVTPLMNKPYPIPIHLLEKMSAIEAEFNIHALIPEFTDEQVRLELEKHQQDIPEFLIDYLNTDHSVERIGESELRKRLIV